MELFFNGIFQYKDDVLEYPMLTLAYLGDSVYELFIRSYLVDKTKTTSYELHKEAIKYVSAKNQARILCEINELLTDDEKNIVRRAKNQKTQTLPKNALPEDYKQATALEALIGYLYIKKEYERLQTLLEAAAGIQKGTQ